MPTFTSNIQDILWTEIILETGAVDSEKMSKAKDATAEMNFHGIQKPLFSVLLDKGFLSMDQYKELSGIIGTISFRCPHCREKLKLAKLDRHGMVTCGRCKAKKS